MTYSLAGKTAVVTGATRNMGRAVAVMLAGHQANVVVHCRSKASLAEAEETARLVESAGGRAAVYQGELTDQQSVEAVFEFADRTFGELGVLVNTAGKVIKKPIAQITEQDYDDSFMINAKVPFFAMQSAAKRMTAGGRIINIGTTLLGATTGLYSIYAGSKAPLEDFTRALAKEIGASGVTVNTIAPGPLDTSFFHPAETKESTDFLKHMSVTGELGKVEQIVPTIEFLISPEAQWVTAQTIFVNGGFVAR
ncbi:dehydrogenase of unknown specificity, short-chain alcohol dehydrogenase like protein [Terriglobus roseus DSM 18391]|uniref:NAD(P)-dependent dehydrogenase, short-chain alcohol dehydrogenase family n=1 Tax=Terriglobus roseus (strain DSM 18391 / NRRL B-41598 / KBS 63) TaxID=926566 RepID=I3ZIU6_TERRK|nr:SDR family oxidoreductase [Terriglobus roseus]AFL89164.1 dehydrogenase of unknown specificity, short-chain alcohol dehydrogenase like protein [Terriglobus roseus DSM 18391]